MCICVNCRHINNCKTYHFIQLQHKLNLKETHKIECSKNFIPINTIVQINIYNKRNTKKIIFDWDLVECLSFVEKPGFWLLIENTSHI